jgi:fatty-acyl-CoA synthase
VSAIRHPGELALVDDRGSLTSDDCTGARTRSPAPGATRASAPAPGVAILCRNHRGLVDATIACSKLGADARFMNIAFAARSSPGSARASSRAHRLRRGALRDRRRLRPRPPALRRWSGGAGDNVPRLDELAEPGDASDIVAPDRAGRIVILTSGTTGPPRGAIRSRLESLGPSRRCCRGSHCACVSAR